MLWPKINSYKEFDNEKKFLRLENSSPPHNLSNGSSLRKLRVAFTANSERQIQVENFSKQKISRSKLSRTIVMDKTGVKLLIFQ